MNPLPISFRKPVNLQRLLRVESVHDGERVELGLVLLEQLSPRMTSSKVGCCFLSTR